MKVVYPGDMKGHHVVGRKAVSLVPGENDVPDQMGQALIDAGIVIPIEETHLRVESEETEEERRAESEAE